MHLARAPLTKSALVPGRAVISLFSLSKVDSGGVDNRKLRELNYLATSDQGNVLGGCPLLDVSTR